MITEILAAKVPTLFLAISCICWFQRSNQSHSQYHEIYLFWKKNVSVHGVNNFFIFPKKMLWKLECWGHKLLFAKPEIESKYHGFYIISHFCEFEEIPLERKLKQWIHVTYLFKHLFMHYCLLFEKQNKLAYIYPNLSICKFKWGIFLFEF